MYNLCVILIVSTILKQYQHVFNTYVTLIRLPRWKKCEDRFISQFFCILFSNYFLQRDCCLQKETNLRKILEL